MKKLLFGFHVFACLVQSFSAHAEESAHVEEKAAAEKAHAEEKAPVEEKPGVASADLGFVLVPLGLAYTRSGVGVSARYEAPLVKRPGILWETTNVAVGVREFYAYVNNQLAAFVEVTPIAFFKLQLSAGYDSYIVKPLSGGVRALTPVGRQKLADGDVARGGRDAVDWVDGRDNRDIFFAPVGGDGLRLKIQPTLQAKIGPVGLQYNFTADFNVHRAGKYDRNAIFYDSLTFTLRKVRDVGYINELVAVFEVPGIRDQLRAGVIGNHYHVVGTDLDRLSLNALIFYRPRWQCLGERLSPWITGQFGTHLLDPMHQFDFSWVLAIGLDLRLFGGPRTSALTPLRVDPHRATYA
jgi:hypothetical protein